MIRTHIFLSLFLVLGALSPGVAVPLSVVAPEAVGLSSDGLEKIDAVAEKLIAEKKLGSAPRRGVWARILSADWCFGI